LIISHAVQAWLFPQAMNIRMTFAILLFAACAAFAERLTEQRYAVPWLRAFGVIGMVALMVILQLTMAGNGV